MRHPDLPRPVRCTGPRRWPPPVFVALGCLLATPLSGNPGPAIAPNTVDRAFHRAQPSVVKLYGRGIGREHGYATGFLVSADGKILTALSLLTSTGRPRAVLADGRRFEAAIERTDDQRQLALLRIDATDLPFLELAPTEDLAPGDTVIALGNWFKIAEGEEPVSVNRGILGMKGQLDARRLTQDFEYRGPALYFDAMTSNPGAPGGPLLDVEGRCIGMIGRIVEATSTNTRINYALPSEELSAFLGGESMQGATTQNAPRDEREPYLGIRLSRLGFRQVPAYIERVAAGSPAAEAGLKADDLILSIDARRINDARDYEAALAELQPGQVTTLIVKRGSALHKATLKVAAKEEPR